MKEKIKVTKKFKVGLSDGKVVFIDADGWSHNTHMNTLSFGISGVTVAMFDKWLYVIEVPATTDETMSET